METFVKEVTLFLSPKSESAPKEQFFFFLSRPQIQMSMVYGKANMKSFKLSPLVQCQKIFDECPLQFRHQEAHLFIEGPNRLGSMHLHLKKGFLCICTSSQEPHPKKACFIMSMPSKAQISLCIQTV